MSSSINPNNIDGNFPVAGQPNNTQGFRDNFTNIKTNFATAATEITDLENNGIFKAALSGTALDNNMADNLIYAAAIRDFSAVAVQLTATSGSITVDYSAGHYQAISTTGSISLNFTNFPPSGSAGIIRLSIAITNTAYTLTLPAAVSLGTTGIQGYSANVITFAATGTYQFEFSTVDSGTTITIFDLNRPLLGSVGAAVGYSTGTGGTVTQATDKSTGVTLNKRCGQITMNAAALAAAAEVSFTLTNSVIAATDVVMVSIASGATAGAYSVQCDATAAGSCRISVGNRNAGSLSEAIVLNFVVIKAVAA
jgi:hypothetical protein